MGRKRKFVDYRNVPTIGKRKVTETDPETGETRVVKRWELGRSYRIVLEPCARCEAPTLAREPSTRTDRMYSVGCRKCLPRLDAWRAEQGRGPWPRRELPPPTDGKLLQAIRRLQGEIVKRSETK